MSRGQAAALALVVLAVGLLSLSLGSRSALGGSTLSLGPGGWFAARKYLEARGAEVELLDTPLEHTAHSGVLVLVFPWQRVDPEERLVGARRHMQRGGTVLLAYTGDRIDLGESLALDQLGLRRRTLRGDVPLNPIRWHRFASEEWLLAAEPGAPSGPIRVRAPHQAPQASAAAEVLYRGPDGTPLAFRERRGSGQLLVLPADAFSNARLAGDGNADLLESLSLGLGPRFTFDEYHHGLQAAPGAGERHGQRVADYLLLHLLILYVLTAAALARRFGPPWREPPVTSGSAADLLLSLGGLHRRLGHHRDAAARLVERALEADPRLRLPEHFERDAADAAGLLRVARAVAWAQAGKGRNG